MVVLSIIYRKTFFLKIFYDYFVYRCFIFYFSLYIKMHFCFIFSEEVRSRGTHLDLLHPVVAVGSAVLLFKGYNFWNLQFIDKSWKFIDLYIDCHNVELWLWLCLLRNRFILLVFHLYSVAHFPINIRVCTNAQLCAHLKSNTQRWRILVTLVAY